MAVPSLFPYPPLLGDLTIALEEAKIDGTKLPDTYINRQDLIANVSAVRGGQWLEAELYLKVEAPYGEIQGRRDIVGTPRVLVRIQCGPTNVRQTKVFTLDSGELRARLTIPRDVYAATATVDAFVVADIKIASRVTQNRILAEAASWKIRFQQPTVMEIAERRAGNKRFGLKALVQPQWVDFANPPRELSFLIDQQNQPYYLQLHGSEPALYLNDALPGYRSLLSERKGRAEIEKGYRDSELGSIAGNVMQAMFNSAVAALEKASDDQEPYLPEDWRKDVVQGLCRFIYPQSSLLEAFTNLHEAKSDDTGDDMRTLQELLQTGVQRFLEKGEKLQATLAKLGP